MNKHLQRRYNKGIAIAKTYGAVEVYGVGYRTRSSMGGWYYQRVTLEKGKLVYAQCNCPDFGECTHNGVPVCKHVLAVCLLLTRRVKPVDPSLAAHVKEITNANAAQPSRPARPMFYPPPAW